MLNIIGLSLAVLGTFISLITVIFSKYQKDGLTYEELKNLHKSFRKQKYTSIIGFALIFVGFVLQLISAIESM